MSQDEIRNVLVLGTCGVQIAQFVKLFEAYLQYESYEDAVKWQPNLSQTEVVNDITSSSLVIGNRKMNFIYAPNPSVECVGKQFISILLNFIQKQEITAIIFLVKPTEQNELFQKYKNCLLSRLEQFDANNILYIFALGNDSYKYQQFMDNTFRQERREFYFEEDIFYKICKDNWIQCRNICKNVYKHIMGESDINGLQNIYIQSAISKKSILKLADDLLELLIQIYIISTYGIIYNIPDCPLYSMYIINYKNNVTACYGNNCIQWKTNEHSYLRMKIPKICHGPCKCTELDTDVNKCTMFDTCDKMCFKCKCDIDSHSRYVFQFGEVSISSDYTARSEKHIALNNLAIFSLYKKQNQEVYSMDNIFNRVLNLNDSWHPTFFNDFKEEFNAEVKKLENTLITEENILTCLNKLFQIKEAASIIPQFIYEMFPIDFQLGIIPEVNVSKKETKINIKRKMTKINNDKMETEVLRNEIVELRQMLQNANDLNSKLIQDMRNLTLQCKCQQNKEEIEEK